MKRINVLISGIIIFLLFLIIFIYFSQKRIKEEILSLSEAHFQELNQIVSQGLTESIKIYLEEGNEMLLNSILYEIKRKNPKIEEISIINKDGLIIAHSNPASIFTPFKLNEEILSQIRLKNIFIRDKILSFNPITTGSNDTIGYLFLSLYFPNIKEKEKYLNNIFFISLGLFFSGVVLIFAIMLFIFLPEKEKIRLTSPKFKDFLYHILPQSSHIFVEKWEIYPYYKKGDLSNLFYKVGRLHSEKWFFFCFEGVSSGYGWSLILSFVNAYLSKFLFLDEDPLSILKGLLEELKNLPFKEGVVEGTLIIFDEFRGKLKGASFGDHILYKIKNKKAIPIYTSKSFFDYSTSKGEIVSFEDHFEDMFIFLSGGFIRWDKSKIMIEDIEKCENIEDCIRVLEEYNILLDKEKMEEDKLLILFNFKKEAT